MPSTAISAASLQANRLLEFLRDELKPTPGRWQVTLRITLACVAASFPVMAFQLHVPLIVMILMFLVTRQDTTTTLLITVLAIIGLTIGCGLLLLAYVCIADLTWLRVLSVPAFIALGLFINRILTLGPVGSAIGIPLAMGMIVPDIIPSTEFLTRFPFYVWWAAVLGLTVSLGVQYMLNPERAQSVLVRGLTSRLEAVEAALLRLAAEERKQPPPVSLVSLALKGAAEQLHLLKLASIAEPALKQNQAQLVAQIVLVDRLVTATCVLEEQGVGLPNEVIEKRLRRIARAAARWREAVIAHSWPEVESPVEGGPQDPGALPAMAEMERVLELVSRVKKEGSLPDELKVFPTALKGGPLLPDAFRNPDYVRFAVKGALAGFICYLIFTLTAYQNIYTSVITCIVCSLSTIGASVQKGVMRLAGSALGGVLGVLTLTYIFPNLDSIGGFWVPFAAVTALAAYVTFGSPAISYAGYQIGLAFYKCVLQSYGPYTELRVVRDRLLGILLGLAVFGVINTQLWPVKALAATRAKLASALRTLARLAGLPDDTKELAPRLAEAYELRLLAYQDFGAVQQLLDGAKFEPGAALRRRLEGISTTAQKLFLYVLAIIQHRPDLRPEAVPEPLRAAASRFRTVLAEALQTLGDRTIERGDHTLPDLQRALADLEQTLALHMKTITDAEVAAQVRARFTLYKEAVPVVLQLADEIQANDPTERTQPQYRLLKPSTIP